MKLLIALTIASLLMAAESWSQSPSLIVYPLQESNGLSDNRVTCMLQDQGGVMWIGTEDGLNRYDGSVFNVFKRKKNDPDEIADNFIHALAEDDQHHIWIGTNNGLSELNPQTNELKTYDVLKGHDARVIKKVLADHSGNIWLGTLGGLIQFIPGQNKLVNHRVPNGLPADHRISDVLIDRQGRFWVATFNDLWQFDPKTDTFTRPAFEVLKGPSHGLINTLAEDHAGRLWLGYWDAGVKWIDPDRHTSGSLDAPLLPAGLSGIAEIKNRRGHHELWMGNFFQVDEQLRVSRFDTNIGATVGNYQVTCLYGSNDNLLWAGTNRGVLIMDPGKQFFRHQILATSELSHQGVAAYENDRGLYLGGAGSHFLALYDTAYRRLRNYPFLHPAPFRITGDPAMLSIVPDDADHLWLGTEEGLMRLDERSGAQQLFRIPSTASNVPTRNFIDHIFVDSRRVHWVFGWRAGIWQFDVDSEQFKQMIVGLTKLNEVKGFLIADAAEDDRHNVWFADLDEGLIFFNRQTNSFSKPPNAFFQSWFNLGRVIYESPYVWGVTQGTVFRIHHETFVLETWKIPDELNKPVTAVCPDQQHHLWIGTRRGLVSFDQKTFTFKQFTTNDGLIDNVMDGTLYCLKSGKMAYYDDNYVTTFDPSAFNEPSAIPKVVITGVLSQNQPVAIHPTSDGNRSIELDYTYNNFIFNWAALHFSNPLQNKYYCMLEGVDNDWKFVGNTGNAQYASLSPGTYVFRARAATSDGVMNTTGDAVLIIIHPPFWRTWWFYAVGIFSFIGITYTWYRYRLNEALKTERLRNKISTDLHDEIGSTLSSISIMSDLVVQKSTEEKTLRVAHEIRENAVVLMERMEDIVWSINPKNDSLENLLLRIKRFAAHVFEAKNIDYEIHISAGIDHLALPMEVRQHIYLILKEGINNVVKHAACTRAVIEVTYQQAVLHIRLADNGKGFDISAPTSGHGVGSMKNRAAAMKMNFTLSSAVGKGTTIDVQLKIK